MSYIDYGARPKSRTQEQYTDEDPFADEAPPRGNNGAGGFNSGLAGGSGRRSYDEGVAVGQPEYGGAGSRSGHGQGDGAQQYQHHTHQPGHQFQVERIAGEGELRPGHDGGYQPFGADGQHQEPFFDPTFEDYTHEQPLEMPFFDHVVQDYGSFGFLQRNRLRFRQALSFLLTLGGLGAVVALAFASYFNPFTKRPPRARADREYERRMTGERGSGRVQYYAEVGLSPSLSSL